MLARYRQGRFAREFQKHKSVPQEFQGVLVDTPPVHKCELMEETRFHGHRFFCTHPPRGSDRTEYEFLASQSKVRVQAVNSG